MRTYSGFASHGEIEGASVKEEKRTMDIEKMQSVEIRRLKSWLSRIQTDHAMANRVKLYARMALEGAPVESRPVEPASGLEQSLVSFAEAVERRSAAKARFRRYID